MSRARVHVFGAVVGALLFATTGCASEGDGPPSITADEATRQFHTEAANWDLPAGWEWPEEPYSGQGPDGEPAVYDIEIGRVDASRYWYCAWSRALIAADTEERRQAALTQVLRVRETPYYQIGLENTGPTDARLEAVEVGDLSELADYAEANCAEGPQG